MSRPLARHVTQVASYLRDGCSDAVALDAVGIDQRYSATYRTQVLSEARDWWQQMKQAGRPEWVGAHNP